MKTLEEAKKEYKIVPVGNHFFIEHDGAMETQFADKLEAEDYIEDQAEEALKDIYYYHCEFCNAYFEKDEPEHRIEDRRFTAPYGSIVVIGGDVGAVPVCPVCNEDLEEV